MSRLAIDDMFYGKPERVRYVTGGGGSGGYGGSYQAGPHYYSDGGNHYSRDYSHGGGHSTTRAPMYPSPASGRPVLPDVKLSVPMDSLRCVEKVKEALDISGVYSVHCDIPSQTVAVSGSVAPPALLKRVKQVKRKSKILSYTGIYTEMSGHNMARSSHHGRSSSSSMEYGMPSPGYGSSSMYNHGSDFYSRSSGRLPSPPKDQLSYYRRDSDQVIAHPGGYNNQFRSSGHDHRRLDTNYY